MQIVRCRAYGEHTTELIFTQPNDFFLTSNPSMIDTETSGSFANRKLVLNNPGQMAGHNA